MNLRVLLTIGFLLSTAAPAAAMRIVSPSAGATVAPNQLVTVRIALDPGETLSQVGVFSEGQARPATLANNVYEAQVRIPREAVGPDLLIAYGLPTDGGLLFAELEVNVDPGPVRGLFVDVPRVLTFAGQTSGVEVHALFEDGILRDVSAPAAGTTYSSSDAEVLGVHPDGIIQARRTGKAKLEVSSRGKQASVDISVTLPATGVNRIPVITPGADQTAVAETHVTLSATATDADGDPIEYIWDQIGGRVVVLYDRNSASPTFVAPNTAQPQELRFHVAARDSKGATTLPVLVKVTVTPAPAGQ